MTVSVRTCSSDAELRRSLEIFNEVWPNRAATAKDVAAWKQGALATVEFSTRADRRTADHGMTAVRRDWRNRGVASALKRAQIAWAQEHGFERLTAANEERNAAMQHINSLLGYRLIPGRVRLRASIRKTSLR